MTPARAAEILAEVNRRRAVRDSVVRRLRAWCFDRQIAFIDDPSRLKAAVCTRRAGKSEMAAVYLVLMAWLKPQAVALYIALTRQSAKDIMWDRLQAILNEVGVSFSVNATELVIRLSNGGRIKLFGADADRKQREKIRGIAPSVVVVDEAASFLSGLRDLVDKVLVPATSDHQASICLIGTPGEFIGPTGEGRQLFYAATEEAAQGWSVHRWSALDNPHMHENFEADRLDVLRRKGPLFAESAEYQNEWLGRWAVDSSRIVYRFREDRNIVDADVPCEFHVIACDLGWNDATAFVVAGWNRHDPNLYIRRAYKQSRLNFDQVAAELRALSSTYAGNRLVIDGANKQGVEHMRDVYGLALEAAEKAGKADFIRQMNTDLTTGRVRLVAGACDPLVEEWSTLMWDPYARIPTELATCENHCSDAALYGWRHAHHYLATPEEVDTRDPVTRSFHESRDRRMRRLRGEYDDDE